MSMHFAVKMQSKVQSKSSHYDLVDHWLVLSGAKNVYCSAVFFVDSYVLPGLSPVRTRPCWASKELPHINFNVRESLADFYC